MAIFDTTRQDIAVPPREHAAGGIRVIALPWHRLALGAVLLIAAFLNFYRLAEEGYANSYYAAAVRSMSLNWHNFFFTAFDPAGFVTIDKPPLGFWFQVASVKLFGYSGSSLLFPEALAGVLSVALLYHLVGRTFGRAAGLLSALILAITPVAVADNRNNTIDSILVLFMLLGAWAVSRAVDARAGGGSRRAGLRWLLLCAVLVGLGFNIKMLEAYLVVPAFGLVYLLGAQVRWRARLIHLALAAAVMLAVSLSWAVAVDLTPANQRPWVDSTTTNSEIDLAIGYNGLQRLLGRGAQGRQAVPVVGQGSTAAIQRVQTGTTPGAGSTGAVPASTAGSRVAQGSGGGPGGLFDNGAVGPFRLLDTQLGGQAGWLLPLAVIGLLVAGMRRVRFPLDSRQRGLVMWGTWLFTMVGFFSVAGFFHSYYLVTVAPAIAALAGIGLVALWEQYAQHTALSDWRGWLLPVALLATAVAQVHILGDYPSWSRWLSPLVLGGTVIAALLLVAARIRPWRALRVWTPVVAAAGAIALLVAPAVWAADTTGNGGGGLPSGGPSAQGASGFGRFQGGFPAGGFPGGPGSSGGSATGAQAGQPPAGARGFGGGGAGVDAGLLRYLEQHQGAATYLFATTSSNGAAPYIIQTGKAVMALGGFGGSDPILSVAQFKSLVKNGTVRYVLGGGMGGGPDGGSSVTRWAATACTAVPASAWQGTSSAGGGAVQDFGGVQSLYDCAGA